MAHTLIVVGPEPRSVSVETDLVVGRGAECDLRFADDRRMSRRHARFWVEAGELLIEDLGGVNGTLVNNVPVRGRANLVDGDTIQLGKTELRVGALHTVETPPELVKPAEQALGPDLERMVADDFFAAIGLAEQTLVDARSQEDLVHQTRRFAVLHQISHSVQRADGVEALLGRTLELLIKVMPVDRVFAALVDRDGHPVSVMSRGANSPPDDAPVISTTITEYVVHRRTSIISRDASADVRFEAAPSLMLNETRAVMAAPIIQGDTVVGILGAQNSHLRPPFREPDVDMITIVGAMVGQALAKLQMAEKREETIRALKRARADLLQAQEELIRSQQMAVIGRLAAGIAHEVKNHLSPFMLADMIARKYPNDEDIQESKSIMLEARQHILDLVNEVRHFVSGADASYRFEITDLAHVLRQVLRFMQCDKVVKQADVQLEIADEPLVDLDAARFRQVLINLIRNAADAVPSDRRAKITLSLAEEGQQCVVGVQDNGRGISPKVAERVFEPFFTTKGGGGLGLGLDISRKIVQAHHGRITFESKLGEGATFLVYLPIAQGD